MGAEDRPAEARCADESGVGLENGLDRSWVWPEHPRAGRLPDTSFFDSKLTPCPLVSLSFFHEEESYQAVYYPRFDVTS